MFRSRCHNVALLCVALRETSYSQLRHCCMVYAARTPVMRALPCRRHVMLHGYGVMAQQRYRRRAATLFKRVTAATVTRHTRRERSLFCRSCVIRHVNSRDSMRHPILIYGEGIQEMVGRTRAGIFLLHIHLRFFV